MLDVFHKVASRYDLMNDAMSCGVHRLWKDSFVRGLDPAPDTSLLDVAGGTGEVGARGKIEAGQSKCLFSPCIFTCGELLFRQTFKLLPNFLQSSDE